jgi:hypothetical protein
MTRLYPQTTWEAYARNSVLEYLLIGDLRDLLEEPADEETRHWLLAVLDQLLSLLPSEFEFEDRDGYLSDVCEENPNWAPKVDRLHQQREELYHALWRLRNRIADEENYDIIADEIKPQLRKWINAERRLRASERNLVVMSYDTTFGGEG